jgi:FkbM family methyltransferase
MNSLTSGLENLVYSTRLAVPATLVALRLAAIGRPRIQQSYRYKRLILQIMRRTLRKDSNAVDIGSHRGLFLFPIIGHAPAGKHIAIEPIPFLANRLSKRFPKVEVRAAAVSDTSGTTKFYLDRRELGYSSLVSWERRATNTSFIEEIDVPVLTLDEIVPEGRKIDLIKMDAMGAHVKILRGALGVIRRCRPVIIMYLRNPPGGDPPEQSAVSTWDILVEQGGMKISRVADFVAGRPELPRAQFLASIGRHDGSEFCFVASAGASGAAA